MAVTHSTKGFRNDKDKDKDSLGGLQTFFPLLIRSVMAYVHRVWAGTHLIQYALVPVTTARWSPITRYVVFYPDLLAVGGDTHDMFACIVRQDYTGAHIHALGWTSPQRLFILRLLRRGRLPKFKMTRQFEQCSSLWNFTNCMKVSTIYV